MMLVFYLNKRYFSHDITLIASVVGGRVISHGIGGILIPALIAYSVRTFVFCDPLFLRYFTGRRILVLVQPEDGAYFPICKTNQNGTSSGFRTGFRSLLVATYGGSLNKEKGGDGRD